MGAGLGGKPILNTDVFCFGLPDQTFAQLPKGVLHPKRVFKGVVSGVRDYGNRMGIPTANGAVLFDKRYTCNPLVYCGTVGLIPKNKVNKKVTPGEMIVAVGGRTGRDGIHGATFSSLSLEENIESSVVQIGNPIVEKKILDVMLQARDKNLYTAVTDCGAGGFSSAVGELGQDCGARVYLDKAPLKYSGLAPWEIWVSESQERMVLSVPKKNLKIILELFGREDVEAVAIGEFTNDKKLTLFYDNALVGQLDMDFLHDGLPRLKRPAVWKRPKTKPIKLKDKSGYSDDLIKILSSLNVCSKEWVIRQYDHEVQGATVTRPLVGISDDAPADACVIRPVLGQNRGIVVSNGINPKYGDADTYWMAASCIDEALRNIVSAGGDLKRTAILDNFCWGKTDNPQQLGTLVRAAKACHDIAIGYGVPFISGKDSLNNEYQEKGKGISIPPTLLISGISVISDIRKVITMDLKQPGNLLYMLGITKDELGMSHFCEINGIIGGRVPTVDAKKGKRLMNSLTRCIRAGLVKSCHDCSEGGLAVAAAEMSFAGGLGAEILLQKVPIHKKAAGYAILFSESNTRFIAEIAPEKALRFEKYMRGNVFAKIGSVTGSKQFIVKGLRGNTVIDRPIDDLKEAWQSPLRW